MLAFLVLEVNSHFRRYKHTLTVEERATRPRVPGACCDLEAEMLEPSMNTTAAFQLGLLSNDFFLFFSSCPLRWQELF